MRINPIRLVGIALVVRGIVAFAYQGITYTSREKVIDIGPIHATADTQKTIPLSPLVGGAALVGGIVLVMVGAKKAWFDLKEQHRGRNEAWMILR